MELHFTTEPSENCDTERYVSPNKLWEFGIHRVIFGYRVVASRYDETGWSSGFAMNYCGGADWNVIEELQDVCKAILEKLPEIATERDLTSILPTYERRPMNLDPVCFDRLRWLAKNYVYKSTSLVGVGKV